MAFNLFQKDIFHILGISSTASEEEIHNSLSNWKKRVEGGYVQHSEDIEKINTLSSIIDDKKTRIVSMILHGNFEYEDLDRQIRRLKKIFSQSKVHASEWIDVFSSLHVIIYEEKFRGFLLGRCNITKNDSKEDINIFQNAVDEIFQEFLSYVTSECENSFKIAEKVRAFELFKVINEFPGFVVTNKKKSIDNLVGHCGDYLLKVTEQIEKKLEVANIESSKYQIKALLSKLERDMRESVFETFDIILAQEFEGKNELIAKVNEFYMKTLEVYQKHNYSEKTNFFIVEISSRIGASTKLCDGMKNANIAPEIKNVSEVLDNIKNMARQGDPKKARLLFSKEKKKHRMPFEVQLFEQAEIDPFFFMNSKEMAPKLKKSFFIQSKETFKNEDNDKINVLWLKLFMPIYPIRTAVYNEKGNYIGAVSLPLKHKMIGSAIFACLFVLIIYSFICLRSFMVTPSIDEVALNAYNEISADLTKEKRFSELINYLNNPAYVNTSSYKEVTNEIISLTKLLLANFSEKKKMEDFIFYFGNKLVVLPFQIRKLLFKHNYVYLKKYMLENNFEPESVKFWTMRMGGRNAGSLLVNLEIKHFSEKNNVKKIESVLDFSINNKLVISKESLSLIIKKNMITIEQALQLCERYSSLPERYWHKAIMDIWEMCSTFNTKDKIKLLKKIGNNIPKLRVDLLLILLDENKRRVYKWDKEISNIIDIQIPSIKKRALIEACLSYIRAGEYEKVKKYAAMVPKNPENDNLLFLQIPVLFEQNKYGIIIQFLERYIKDEKNKLNDYYKYVLGSSYLKKEKYDKALSYFKDVTDSSFNMHVKIWQKLNNRQSVVRQFVTRMLKEKKGKYEATGRKIYLIQDDNEAKIVRERFVLKEIENDFNVKQIKKEISKATYIFKSIMGLVECFIKSKDSHKLREAKDILFELRNEFYDSNLEISLSRVFFYSGQKSGANDLLKEVEMSCFKNNSFEPLLYVYDTYKEFLYFDGIKKLTKLIGKNCDDDNFIWKTYRKLSEINDENKDKLHWLKKIKDKKLHDTAKIHLLNMQIAQDENDLSRLLHSFEYLLENAEKYNLIEDLYLRTELGDALFYSYRLIHSTKALKYSNEIYQKILEDDGQNEVILNKYFHTLWFLTLEKVFQGNQMIFELKENDLSGLWQSIETLLGKSILQQFNAEEYFKKCKNVFNEILTQNNLFIEPPGFFAVLKAKGIDTSFLDVVINRDLSTISTLSFSEFWGMFGELERKYILKIKEEKMEAAKKILKNTPENEFNKYSDAILNWVENVLCHWKVTEEPLKMGFGKLFERVAFSNGLRPCIRGDRVKLEIKVIKLALWYDPNRQNFYKLSPSWIIQKAFWENQDIKNEEVQPIIEMSKKLISEYTPFINEDLLILLLIDPEYKIEGYGDSLKKVLRLQKSLTPFSYKKKTLEEIEKRIINS